MYTLDLLLPTARFVFAVAGSRVDVVSEHRSPEAFRLYSKLKCDHDVVGMTTFPNTVLLRGPRTILVDPGLHLQNAPVVQALARLGVEVSGVDLIALTHAHGDHAGACADLPLPVALHERELVDPAWPSISGVLSSDRLLELNGDSGELAPGISWTLTPGHSEGSVCYLVDTVDGPVVLAGDTIGPLREPFDAMIVPEDSPSGEQVLANWTTIRGLLPRRVIAGHLPPFDL
jgi:glyoxylase-like metal-dependent hydrolase (beta-lactamase superfamily II)